MIYSITKNAYFSCSTCLHMQLELTRSVVLTGACALDKQDKLVIGSSPSLTCHYVPAEP